MENHAVTHLPEVDSLPDGFVDSSAEPLVSSPATPEQEDQVTDYKEERLVEVDSRPDLVVDDFQSCEGDDGSGDQARTFPVELSEYVGDCDSQKFVKTPGDDCTSGIDAGSPSFVSEKVEQEMAPLSDGKKNAREICRVSEKSTDQGVEAQAAHVQGTIPSESVGASRKDTSEVKRKSAKRTFKSEKEFLEFTLSYQKVLSERDAAISMRDKLESLCRELQRQNKMLMDECKRVSTESQNLRLELSNKFQEAIKDVTNKLEEQRDDSLTQLKENEMLRNQLKQKEDQIALSEQQYAHQLKQKSLELQIADLKIQQHEEKIVREQSQMKMYAEQVSSLLATEKNLRLQLTADSEKFQQFQDALVKSNEVFETFKQEIEKMSKSIKELKKENTFLKGKTEKSDFTLIQLVEEVISPNQQPSTQDTHQETHSDSQQDTNQDTHQEAASAPIQQQKPPTPGRKFAVIKGGFRFPTASTEHVGPKKVIKKIGLGTFSTQPRATPLNETIPMSTPVPTVGTQEFVNQDSKMKKAKKAEPMKYRPRFLRPRLPKIKPGPGLTKEDAMEVE